MSTWLGQNKEERFDAWPSRWASTGLTTTRIRSGVGRHEGSPNQMPRYLVNQKSATYVATAEAASTASIRR